MNPKKILVVAGEPSGDLYASGLIKDLKKLNPGLEFFGIGGDLSKSAGLDIIFDISELALVGLVEVLKNISAVKKAYDKILAKIDSQKIDLAILVDYPGFNLRLAKVLKKRSIPVVYYISPQVWAWGRSRTRTIKECVKKIVVFFKFEEELYKNDGVNAEFVGHPLLDIVKITSPKEEFSRIHGLSKGPVIALLPGSRAIEVKTLLPILVSSSRIIKDRLAKAQFIIAKHPALPMGLYEEAIRNSNLDARIADGDTYNVLGASDFAIVASGTATLETAIIGVPFIIVYKASLLTFILYRLVRTLPFLGLVNVIAGKGIVPELIQFDAAPANIARAALDILSDDKKRGAMLEELKRVKLSLGTSGASLRAAHAILPLLT